MDLRLSWGPRETWANSSWVAEKDPEAEYGINLIFVLVSGALKLNGPLELRSVCGLRDPCGQAPEDVAASLTETPEAAF